MEVPSCVLGFWRILSALKRISLIVQLLGSRQATDTVGDPQEGFRSRFQVDKAFKAPLRFLGFFFLDRLNLSTNKLLGSCCVRGPQRYGDCV